MEEIRIPFAFVVILVLMLVIINRYVIKPREDAAPLSKLAWSALILVFSGFILGKHPVIGYMLIGLGMILAVYDILNNTLKKGKPL